MKPRQRNERPWICHVPCSDLPDRARSFEPAAKGLPHGADFLLANQRRSVYSYRFPPSAGFRVRVEYARFVDRVRLPASRHHPLRARLAPDGTALLVARSRGVAKRAAMKRSKGARRTMRESVVAQRGRGGRAWAVPAIARREAAAAPGPQCGNYQVNDATSEPTSTVHTKPRNE